MSQDIPDSVVVPDNLPDLESIRATAKQIAPHIRTTPYLENYGATLAQQLPDVDLQLKLELFQQTGSFKARAAVAIVQGLSDAAKAQGVTAFSAGNHAIATAYAAAVGGVSAKVVMPSSANPYRVKTCQQYGAEVVLADSIADARLLVERLQQQEGRTPIHPFEGVTTTLGTATLGLEIADADPQLQAVVVPVGGGGLISGIACAFKRVNPSCRVIGVEPEGACGMSQSLQQGSALDTVNVNTIADSLGAPLHLPYSYGIVKSCVDEVVTISDEQMRSMMRTMFEDLNLAVEPAGAAALAAICGPLKDSLSGCRVAAVVCGSNMDRGTWLELTDQAS